MNYDFSHLSKLTIGLVIAFCIILVGVSYYFLFNDRSERAPADVLAKPKTALVKLSAYAVEPATLVVEKGTLVTFKNTSKSAYWITAVAENQLEGFGSNGVINPDDSYSFVFDELGVWKYCEQTFGKLEGSIMVTE